MRWETGTDHVHKMPPNICGGVLGNLHKKQSEIVRTLTKSTIAPSEESWMPRSGAERESKLCGEEMRNESRSADKPQEGIGSQTSPSSLPFSLDLFSHCTAGNREILSPVYHRELRLSTPSKVTE